MAIGLTGFAFLGAALGAVLAMFAGGAGWIALGVFIGANVSTAAAAATRLMLSVWRASPTGESRLA